MSGARGVSGFRLFVAGAAVMALLATLAGPADATPAIQATPTLSTTANPNGTVALGTTALTLQDSATLAAGNSPTGTITFVLNGPGFAQSEVVPVNGNGAYSTTIGWTLFHTLRPAGGAYRWQATYWRDGNNHPAADPGGP